MSVITAEACADPGWQLEQWRERRRVCLEPEQSAHECEHEYRLPSGSRGSPEVVGLRAGSQCTLKRTLYPRPLAEKHKQAWPGQYAQAETSVGRLPRLVSMSKTYKNIYPKIYDFGNLYDAYLAARRGKRFRAEVLKFSRDLEPNLIQLQNELIWKTYRTGTYREFYVYEPKKRIVAALPFRDRVLQHSLVTAIEPIWEKRFICDSYACRRGKGTHAGADRAQEFLRRVKRRHGKVYVLKADISKYFASIDHEVLSALLRKRIACRDTLDLLTEIINSTPGGVGIPIGNLTSQLFANIYLHELDEFVKYTCLEPLYMRYMDDFIIVHHDKVHLCALRRKIEAFLLSSLCLSTNAKTQVFPVAARHGRALDFLGYRIWPTHRKLRKSAVRRMRKRLKQLQCLYGQGEIDLAAVRAVIMSWIGHAKHADTHRLRHTLMSSAIFTKGGRE